MSDKKTMEMIPDDIGNKNIIADNPDIGDDVIIVDKPIEAEQGIDILKSKLDKAKEKYKAEKRARQEAEQAAREAANRVQKATSEVEENQMHLVTNAIDTIKREQEFLKNTIKEAMAVGDFDKSMELQTHYQNNIAKLSRLEDGLQEMKANPRPQQPQPVTPKDIVDDLITRVTPKSARWLEKNKSSLKDPKTLRMMERAHGDALDQGIVAETKEYFRFIENRLGLNKKDKGEKKEKKAEKIKEPTYAYEEPVMSEAANSKQARISAPAAAPVSRDSSPGNNYGSQNGPIKLTADEYEAARISQLSPREYWNNKYGPGAKRA
jgi:hypothetical protein